MINKIAIVPYAEYGRTVMGKDNSINPLKKNKSSIIKENLESQISGDVKVIIDVNRGDLNFLKKDGVDCFLIPEYIKSYVDYGDNKDKCFFLSNDEYDSGNVERFIEYLKEQ